MIRRNIAIRTAIAVLWTGICIMFFALFSSSSSALSGSEFNAGRIIDDAVFYSAGAMNTNQIQTFLNSKVPSCDTNGTQMYNASQTRAQWAAANGRPLPPYTCLKDYAQNVPTVTNGGSDLCKTSISGGTKSAAQIIYDVGQACGINPQVLIVLLQKEQSLVTDDWPWPVQYQSATGYGCPDTAPCDAEFYGFFNQVYQAAKAFRRYEANPNSYNYKAARNNFIYYNPNLSGCGGSNVYIQNQATASLYIYTPYQPNTAALNNLYGSGDSCSAYGNRNFWRMFNDWFGSTFAPSYSWAPWGITVFTDASKTASSTTANMTPGSRVYAQIKIRNTGNQTWSSSSANPMRLGTARPIERQSMFCDTSWLSCSRPAGMLESSVAPNAVATFEFWLKAPMNGANVNEYFVPVVEGIAWLQDNGLHYPIISQPATFTWDTAGITVFSDASKSLPSTTANMAPGSRVYAQIKIRNTGNQTWSNSGANPMRIGTGRPLERLSVFCDNTWLSCSRPTTMLESSVAPNAVATFEFWLKAPMNGANVNEYFNPVIEGFMWLQDKGLHYPVTSQAATYNWELAGITAFTDGTKSVNTSTANLAPGARVYAQIKIRNTGNQTWSSSGANPLRIGTGKPLERQSAYCDPSWLSCSRPTTMIESSVGSNQVATFEFWLKIPMQATSQNEHFVPVIEGLMWLQDRGMHYPITSQTPSYSWDLLTQYAFTDATKTVPRNLSTLQAGDKAYIGFTVRNTGNVTWSNFGSNPVRVGTIDPVERASIFAPGSSWIGASRPTSSIESTVSPNGLATFEFWITTPSGVTGAFNERFGLVVEGKSWLNDDNLSFNTSIIP